MAAPHRVLFVCLGNICRSPTAEAVFRAQAQKAGLKVVAELAFGRDYARTLATWRARFMDQLAAVRALGFDDRFVRKWNYYLQYCEAAFAMRNIDLVQYTLVKA